jgi:hypothetical protein
MGETMNRMLCRLCAAGILLVAPGLTAPRAATPVAAEVGCTAQQRREALGEDQRLVLRQVGALTTLRTPADLVSLAQRGWGVLPHQWVSFGGMGMAIARPDTLGAAVPGVPSETVPTSPRPGLPLLLLYRPSPVAADVTDPHGPDFPYELVGWAYGAPYDDEHVPTTAGPCYTRSDWFVHERGIHDFATWHMVPMPPAERFHGQDPGDEPFAPSPPGVPHRRLWDLHVWLNRDTGVPSVSILDPDGAIPGIDPGVGVSFFHPDTAPDGTR